MHVKQALAAYRGQKSNARRRCIAFNLTFKQWCDFWGDDIDRRGCGRDCLQMQRPMDSGPYEIGNIYKGTPRRNARTAAIVERDRKSAKAYAEVQSALDAAMFSESEPERDFPWVEPEVHNLGMRSPYSSRYNYIR